MKKSVQQGSTVFMVSGSSKKDASFSMIFVSKKQIINTEEEHFYTKSLGTKEVSNTKEDISSMNGLSKLMAMSSGLKRHVHVIEQGSEMLIRPHTIITDRFGCLHDLDSYKISTEYFTKRKNAKKYFRKLKARSGLIFVDESSNFFSHMNK